MAGIDWFRWHHGSVTDPKFGLVAKKAGASRAEVIAVWACLLEAASASDDRGQPGGIDFEAMDDSLGLDDGKAQRIHERMCERNLIDPGSGRIVAWEKRQPKRERDDDNSTERSRAFRERKRQAAAGNADPDDATPRNANATPGNADATAGTPRVEESRKDDDDSGAHARTREGAATPPPAPAPAPAPPPAWDGDPLDDPYVPQRRSEWAAIFAEGSHDFDRTSDRAVELMRRWRDDGVTAGQMRAALRRAEKRAAGPVGCWAAYVDSVLTEQRQLAARAAADPPREPRGRDAPQTQGAAVPTYEESLRAAAADAATKPPKDHLAEQARKAREEAARIAASKVAVPAPAEGATP